MISQIIRSFLQASKPKNKCYLDTCVESYRVWPHLIDYNLHMNNAKYLTKLEHARWKHFSDIGWFKPMWDTRLNIVIGSMEITFIRELGLFTKYEIHSHVLTWDEKYLYIEQRLMVKGKLYGHALFKFAGVRKGKRVMMPEMCETVGLDYNLADSLPVVKHWSALSQAKRERGNIKRR